MNYRHKLFIDYYTDPKSTDTFLNASKSYGKAYPNASDPYSNADRLYKREEIKKEIEGRMKALFDISIEDYAGLLHKEYLNAQNKDSTRLRALELIGKVKNFLNDATVSNTIVSVTSEDIKARIEAKRNALKAVDKPVNNPIDQVSCVAS